jgi:succinyl-diaminopimelate desuccinylase
MSDTLDLAKQLLALESVTPKDNGCQTLIAQRLSKIGFEITHFPINQVANLWAKQKNHSGPVLCFAGHTDVVPPGDLNDWTSPPFTPTERKGKLYARGAADMKSSIAAMVTACERFVAKNPQQAGSIAFLITSDEEGPSIDGTQAVLRELKAKNEIPDWCLVGEASSTEKLGDVIKIGRRGTLSGFLKIKGIQGHVAYPQLAKNPIHAALLPLAEICNVKWDEAVAPFPATTLQFSNIHSGTGANNVIPGLLEASFNLRFSPQITPEEIKKIIEGILTKHGCEFEIKWTLGGKSFLTQTSHDFVQKIASTIEAKMGYAPELSTAGGTSDGRFFAEYGCSVVEVGPNNATIHQIDECIDIEELDELSALYEAILAATLSRT